MPTVSVTLPVSTKLGVLDWYEALMETTLKSESIYARTKETLEQLFKDSALSNTNRAGVLSSVLGTLASHLSTAAINAAVQWTRHSNSW